MSPPVPATLAPTDTVAILYTSGTSGEAKGVMINVGNLDHMVSCTTDASRSIDGTAGSARPRFSLPAILLCRVILDLLLSCLSRNSLLTMSVDLTKLVDEIQSAAPNYFLNVPTLLERVRTGVEDNLRKRRRRDRRYFRSCESCLVNVSILKSHNHGIFSGLVLRV